MRRVVITGLGMVTPLGSGVKATWDRLLKGHSALRPIHRFKVDDMPCQIAAMIPFADEEGLSPEVPREALFNPDDWMSPRERRRVDDFILYGMAAAKEAIADAGWVAESDEDQIRTGVLIGSGVGGLSSIVDGSDTLDEKGPRRVSPFFLPGVLINLIAGNVSIEFGFRGPNHAVVTACSTGAHAIGDAARMIMLDDADVMVAGGAESSICRIGIAGFSAAKALSTNYNDRPAAASRPWDKGRDGFVMGEGAGVVVLEELDHARKRGARIYGELVGYGLTGDAFHITAPAPDGNGAFRCMQTAMKRAGLAPDDIDYINAHGTSTPLGDEIELATVKRLFGNAAARVSMSSTKSSIGHLLGAAGSVEAIFSTLAIHHNVVPPTLNLDDPCEGADTMDLVPFEPREREVRAALSNSFGFGGTNASLVIRQLN